MVGALGTVGSPGQRRFGRPGRRHASSSPLWRGEQRRQRRRRQQLSRRQATQTYPQKRAHFLRAFCFLSDASASGHEVGNQVASALARELAPESA
ncbi:hypothetical protein PSP6_160032 [Paraburkholderia tropica]|nr:hypothetical protein PSP6_160032 [Paraburkholderia tropica]